LVVSPLELVWNLTFGSWDFHLMDSRLDQLRSQLSRPLAHPDAGQMQSSGQEVLAWIVRHLSSLEEQPIGQSASRAEMEALLREPPPEEGQGFARALRDFQERVAPFAFRVNHPRFLAFIPSAPSFLSVLGDVLCAGTNFFAGVWLEASGPAEVEVLVLDWFKEFLGYPAEARGILTGGGSEATLTALVVARERLAQAERDRAVLYVTAERHWSADRAAKVIGLRADQVRPVPTGADYRLIPAALFERVTQDRAAGRLPWAVLANAGATNTGAVDPLAELAELCQAEGLWLHVDAAYGWPAVLVPAERAALAGIDRAASITLDPHKWFAQTFEAGCLLVRDGPLLTQTFALRPDYMQDVAPGTDEVNFADHGIALTRRFRALKIWFSLKALGLGWYRALVERCCRLAELAELLLQKAGCFEVLGARQLSIVCFRYVPSAHHGSELADLALNRLNLALVERLRGTGRAFLSSTMLAGRVALRFCFVNWRTTAGDVEAIVQLLAELGRTLQA
jgi:glutamate/tyrosine decarboxylase-like PLP-dependent enzyme